MKKEIVIVLASMALLVGCNRSNQSANEPAGAERSMDQATNSLSTNSWNTNSIHEPSGAGRGTTSTNSQP